MVARLRSGLWERSGDFSAHKILLSNIALPHETMDAIIKQCNITLPSMLQQAFAVQSSLLTLTRNPVASAISSSVRPPGRVRAT